MKELKHAYVALGILGLIPFIGLTALTVTGHTALPWLNWPVLPMLADYSLLIISFLCGTHWALYLAHRKLQNDDLDLLLVSNIIAVMAWLAPYIYPMAGVLLFYSFLFVLLWWIDRWLWQQEVGTRSYYFMRRAISAFVVISLLVVSLHVLEVLPALQNSALSDGTPLR